MSQYAKDTTVGVDASKSEIERTLDRYGADQFGYFVEATRAVVAFRITGRQVRMMLPLPDKNSFEFTRTPSRGLLRSDAEARKAWEQACRQRWRALALVIKAKLEAIDTGISTIEREFMADIALPTGQTVGEWMAPQIEAAYATGKMPPLLTGGGS